MSPVATSSVPTLPFSTLSDDEVLDELKKYQIGLTVDEARKITEMLRRDPTLVEAVIWGIQGSEHCSYKSSQRFLSNFLTEGKNIILGPKEDSGIVAITDGPKGKRWGCAIAHESHNHPSQIVPYEGAATGVGGVVRDVLCMGARIVGCLDLLRLGDLKTEESRSIASEVARGIAGYGNPLGIPNLGGDTVFDSSYNSNCLVNAIALGIVREDEIIHSYVPKEAGEVGYDLIIVGKPTDRSGFGGASFASAAMEEDKMEQNTGAVQEPNPFLERHLLASFFSLFDWLVETDNLKHVSCKDLGAGGVVCATVEQVSDQGFGAKVELDKVHVSISDLPAEVIGCAETQERLCIGCHPDLTDHILKHFNEVWDLPSIAENARASKVGKVTDDGIFQLTYKGEVVCEAKATDITCGLKYNRPTEPQVLDHPEPEITCEGNSITIDGKSFTFDELFKALISDPNNGNTETITVHYDKNVIGNTILEPGEADAGVIAPLQDLESYVHEGTHPGWELSDEDKWRGIAVAGDGNGRYGRISPYWQGVNAAVESMCNVAAVGGKPRALTDCLNYGNPEIPNQLWELEEGIKGIADACKEVKIDSEPVPVISGNVSLYNGKPDGSSIDPTAIVCCIGVINDARKAISMQLKSGDSAILLIGERKDECGGSSYYQILEDLLEAPRDSLIGKNVPQPDFKVVSKQISFVTGLIEEESVLSCHDISNGGLLLALFEMTSPHRGIGGQIGIDVDLESLNSPSRSDVLLFSQSPGFIVEVPKEASQRALEQAKNLGLSCTEIGFTQGSPELIIRRNDDLLLKFDLKPAFSTWNSSIDESLTK